MATHTVPDVGDAFFVVLFRHVTRLVAVEAVVAAEVIRMAGAAAARAVRSMVVGEGVWPVVPRWQPTGGAMAGGAVSAKKAGVIPRLLMAGCTALWRTLEDTARMALRAWHLTVQTGERKTGLVVIERGLLPTPGSVALVAKPAKASAVGIISFMASDTTGWCARKAAVLMAALAVDSLVPAQERETSERVIDGGSLPPFGCVALAAGPPQSPFMGVILLMTRNAVGWRVPEQQGLMAVPAVDLLVLTYQRECRLRVVDRRPIPPLGRMARFARLA
jgi:hypothetical protein